MENLINGKTASYIDEKSQEVYKIPSICLMEEAGLKAWQFIKTKIDTSEPIVIIAGSGNNGGDALVIAREAINDGINDILVILLGSTISDCNQIQREIIKRYSIFTVSIKNHEIDTTTLQSIATASTIIDGITGTGLRNPLKGDAVLLVNQINKSSAKIFSIDIPSGLGDEVNVNNISVKSDYTICIGPLKSIYYNPNIHARCGEVFALNPSFPPFITKNIKPSAYLANDESPELIPLEIDAYKKIRGHLAIFGGSDKYTGAIRLAAKSAFVSRVGLVSTFVDEIIYPIVASESPSVIVHPTTEVDDINKYNTILCGPGWGENREVLLLSLLKTMKPIVIDADGISAFSSLYKVGKIQGHGTLILTPHMGELKVLANAIVPEYEWTVGKDDKPEDFLKLLQKISVKTGAIVVCKSSVTFIATAARVPVVVAGDNPALGVAGSGDVLAGCIAGLLAGGLSPYKSALYGVLWHKEAGMQCYKENGFFDSISLITYVGKVIAK
ncbi:MAG: NAD(P)H-hydrate dehydratase [Spirochaetaceae bacterium]|nr:NAD(P)H-hydrate dehydratase [Spirochaetaceae bacterium]